MRSTRLTAVVKGSALVIALALPMSVALAAPMEAAAVGKTTSATPADRHLRNAHRGEPLEPCAPSGRVQGFTTRESRGKGFRVDACGRRVDDAGNLISEPEARVAAGGATKVAAPVTIDRMTTRLYSSYYGPAGSMVLVGGADLYTLSDGSQWPSGAGGYYNYGARLDHVEVSGTTLRFVLAAPDSNLIYEQTDYDSGDHSAQGQLAPAGPLVLEAEAGSTTAVLRGSALLVSNGQTWYGGHFNFYSAIVGSVVPFEVTYTLQSGVWSADSFAGFFNYSAAGWVDFAHPVSVPRAVALAITGPPRVPDSFTTPYKAIVSYENGVERNVSVAAAWTVDPAALASIDSGVLTTGALATGEAQLTLHAEYTEGDTLAASKQVRCLADDPAEKPGSWPMYQADARHTGHVHVAFDPAGFTLRWQRNLGGGLWLNPVAAGEGKVFASLLTYFRNVPTFFALRAQDGVTLWSKNFGDVFTVDPPAFAYGNVYVQVIDGNEHASLNAFDGDTGATVFQASQSAQWYRYLGPTLFEGKAYAGDGAYGGMSGFDAYSGDRDWFAPLQQYDGWTPAVDASRTYEYFGDYQAGLYAQARATGVSDLFIADPSFGWNGWSMSSAPVLGAHDDAIVIQNGRLISFDTTAAGAIRWEFHSQFSGQPSVAHDLIYAIDAGRLRVLDELAHSELWSWAPDQGDLQGPIVVTDTDVFVSSGDTVYALDMVTRHPVWSFPASGHLAIADGMLYVASSDGILRAFSSPPALSFYTVTPCRVMDTRLRYGVPNVGPALASGTPRLVNIASQCGLPLTAKAVSLNLTVTGAQSAGNLALGGSGGATNGASFLSYRAGQTRANSAVVGLDLNGDMTALAVQDFGTTELIIDVNGYFQ